jgi:hypothetical protein
VSFVKDMYGQEKGFDLIDARFSIIPPLSNIRQFAGNITRVTQWTSAKYKDMVILWLATLARLLQGHPNNIKIIKSGTDFILFARYHSHTETTLKYLHDVLSGISSNIHLIILYRKSQIISKIANSDPLLLYIECIREMGSASNSESELPGAAHENLFSDVYCSSNEVIYIRQLLQWEPH